MMLAISKYNYGWPFGKYARGKKENGQWPAIVFSSDKQHTMEEGEFQLKSVYD